jgi:hypothetical protein
MKILFDVARLTRPYNLRRCAYQLMHLAICASHMGHDVKFRVSGKLLDQHDFLNAIRTMWTNDMEEVDIYIAKSDAYYVDENWDEVSKLKAFKVCMCNSDRYFRENTGRWKRHNGVAVQTRCDLYMPANHSEDLLKNYGHKTVPAAHPIAPQMVDFFIAHGMYQDFLADNIIEIRQKFAVRETGRAGFMGSSQPGVTRVKLVDKFPKWVEFRWERLEHPSEYIRWMLCRRGCIDMRGYGDKSLRFTEAALFGRTIITVNRPSQYSPRLVNNHNCVAANNWDVLNLEYDHRKWNELSEQATCDYVDGWSILAQMKTIVERAK